MKLHYLTPLYTHPGPVASVYLATSRDLDDPDRAIGLRWRRLREHLLAHDADHSTLDALSEAVGSDREVAGPHGQALFAAQGSLLLAESLPEPPARDTARYGAVPDALPLALQHTPDIPYAAVVIHRVHTVDTGNTEDELEVEYETGRWPMSRVAPQRSRGRRIPVDGWPKEAEQLLAELTARTEADGTEVIVLAGDPWAANALTKEAPRHLQDHFIRLKDGLPRPPEPGRARLETELRPLLADRLAEQDRQQLDAFRAQRARYHDDVEGLAATVTALRRGQARALLINRPAQLSGHLWAGPEPEHIGLTGIELNAFGVGYYWEEDPGAALIRAAFGTQAELIAVDREELPLQDGLAVLLRYAGA
ncbi:hypothetical protein [Streptomyces sp. ISL-86]|uniref:baeRF2 domain-containing protein n=1 Tax=Streptomyces sp. ISL-86 TaxID=2819187 RepID=UPI001BE8EA72|nr:hypothetical protein [Streptomyces sp. ISL-86]MBT2459088.1 hypothetical protein [Streptomyces sp. ISL-86]